jgi:hypothetical protein
MNSDIGRKIIRTFAHNRAALDLAESGYGGPLDILDHIDHFNAAKILDGLGETWAIAQTYFKPYACCRWLHAPLDCLLDLMNRFWQRIYPAGTRREPAPRGKRPADRRT